MCPVRTMMGVGNIVSATIMKIHKAFFVIVFTWAVGLASISIQFITKEVELLIPTPRGNRSQIKKWKRNYGQVYQLAEEINRSFGPCLVAFLTNQFLYFAFIPYQLYSDWNNENFRKILFLMRTLANFSYILLILYSSKTVIDKVSLIASIESIYNIFWINFFNPNDHFRILFGRFPHWSVLWALDGCTMIQSSQRYYSNTLPVSGFIASIEWLWLQVDSLITSISHNSPKISAMGLVEICPEMLPVVSMV